MQEMIVLLQYSTIYNIFILHSTYPFLAARSVAKRALVTVELVQLLGLLEQHLAVILHHIQ